MIIFDLDGTLWDTVNVTYQTTINITSNQADINKINKNTVKTGMGLTFSENAKHYMPNVSKEKREKIVKQINNDIVNNLSTENINKISNVSIENSLDAIYDLLHIMTEQLEMFSEKIANEFYE